MSIEAVNQFVFVIRDEAEKEIAGLVIPDAAIKKTTQGTIISVGTKVNDERIVVGKKALFHKQSGQEIDFCGVEITVLNYEHYQVLGVI